MKENDDPNLSKLLQSWEVSQEAPVGFEREVWNRIAARAETPASVFGQFLDLLSGKLLRPQTACAIGLAVIAGGVALGIHNAGVKMEQKETLAAQHYVLSIDPVTYHQTLVQR
ncbi:hypothetical protein QQ054_09335 [Oscillatoria amoena NRMC-F 0135]|nr:hypothetical protein [Oscillatoria laete-virens]MDL5046236.1 hypothetical protein [Oscillatoria amoena NRMC-F 0135]MDL5053938.1 hypothetical protein [Oscillatoria laete-virens NRMC-F 0139]